MNIDLMRRIDRLAGNPLCRLAAPLAPWFQRTPKGEKVVVCKFFGMGSILLSHPLLVELKGKGLDVVYLTFSGNGEVLDLMGAGDTLVIDTGSPWTFARDAFRCIWRLRRLRPSYFLNLEFFSRFAALMALASGAPNRAGFHMVHLPVGRLYTHRANLNVYRHIADNFLNVGRAAGLLGEVRPLGEYIEAFPRPPAESPPDDVATPFIVINAESSSTIRMLRSWTIEGWARVISGLGEDYPDHSIVLVGTGESAGLYRDLLSRLDEDAKITALFGRTTVPQLWDLISRASLVLSVDSGPLHLSAFLKRPTVCLFGPETPVLYGYSLPWTRTLYKGLFCSPCLALYDAKQSLLNCGDNQCMKRITADEVLAAARDLMAGPVASPSPAGGPGPSPQRRSITERTSPR